MRWLLTLTILGSFLHPMQAADGTCYLKEGDRVGFFGDSITEAKIYHQVTEMVFRHFHPESKVTFVNNGHGGLQLAGSGLDNMIAGDPTVVLVLIGMNDAIGAGWVRGQPMAPAVEAYRSKLTTRVRELKGLGKQVVLLTPTLTDETAAISCFRTEGTRTLLTALGGACKAVAKAESVLCIDVQAEFEAYEESLPRFAQLRPDGVHPCARGHYQIARSLWRGLNLAGALSGDRAPTATAELDVALDLTAKLTAVEATQLGFTISATKPGPGTISWSAGAVRGTAAVQLSGATPWSLTLPASAWPQRTGTSISVVLDIASGGARKCFVLDVFRKPVIHGKDGTASGVIADAAGVKCATYSFRIEGRDLRFDATVTKPELFPSPGNEYPWGTGDALTLYLDTRPAAGLGGLGFDGGVYQVWFRPQDKPTFSPGFLPSAGKHMANIATAFGERTATGYTLGLHMSGYINLKEQLDLADRDAIGADITLIYAAALGKQAWLNLQQADRPGHHFPGTFALIDLRGKIAADAILSASTFPESF